MPIHDWTKVDDGVFHDFHHEWISRIKHTLNNGVLPRDYYAMADHFLTPDEYVNVPLEASYQAAWQDLPERWREVVEASR
jgi:hypothetical protein